MRWLTTFRLSWVDVWLLAMAVIAWIDATETRARLRRQQRHTTEIYPWPDLPDYRSSKTVIILQPPYDWKEQGDG